MKNIKSESLSKGVEELLSLCGEFHREGRGKREGKKTKEFKSSKIHFKDTPISVEIRRMIEDIKADNPFMGNGEIVIKDGIKLRKRKPFQGRLNIIASERGGASDTEKSDDWIKDDEIRKAQKKIKATADKLEAGCNCSNCVYNIINKKCYNKSGICDKYDSIFEFVALTAKKINILLPELAEGKRRIDINYAHLKPLMHVYSKAMGKPFNEILMRDFTDYLCKHIFNQRALSAVKSADGGQAERISGATA